jgi:CBS-domain-containing membrane protein
MAQRDVATCAPNATIGEVRQRVHDFCLVVNAENVVLGSLDGEQLEGHPEARAERVMHLAPKTTRPSATPKELMKRLGDAPRIVVTDSDGVLVGLVLRKDVEAALETRTGGRGDP